MKTTLIVMAVLLWAVCGGLSIVSAAQLTPELEAKLAVRSNDDLISILVFMQAQPDVKGLAIQAQLERQIRQMTHQVLMEEMRAFAAADQAPLRQLLEAGVRAGTVRSYETYWIANALQAEVTKEFIAAIAARSDIGIISEDFEMQSLYAPTYQGSDNAHDGQGAFVGLHHIGADSMWALGYTGAGTLIASFDSGIDGVHPALVNSYRGNHGYSSPECWFDPIYNQTYPHWNSSLASGPHGTATMGVMVGKDDATGDTVGVAFDAEWISAMVVDIPRANYLEAFQWAADPDGDPNTIDDVPDVLNNSWGFSQSSLACYDIFWTPIDNLEALGTVVVFSAGNSGPGSMTLRNPANRATTPYANFSVGAVLASNPDSIWSGSSRGPSDCDGISVKPEVVAPGYQIRTTFPGTATPYTLATGTSFSAPYVSGAVALLRQYNPNATVDQIKAALMNSAVDKGVAGEDNTYGWGLIDIPAAMALLPPNNQPNLYLHGISPDIVSSGQQVSVTIAIRNSGVLVSSVTGTLSEPSSGLSVVNGSASFGDIAANASADNSSSPFVFQIGTSLPEGTTLSAKLHLQGNSGAYQKDIRIWLAVGSFLQKSTYTHLTDSCGFTISNFGTYGLAPGAISQHGGVGFVQPTTGTNNLFQCGLLIGSDSDHVSDGVVNRAGIADLDFTVAPGGNLVSYTGGGLGDVETSSRFSDQMARNPLGIVVKQQTAHFDGSAPESRCVVMQYIITNVSQNPINDLYVGLFCDWDLAWNSGGLDRTGFARDLSLGYMWQNAANIYRGTAVLNQEDVQTYYAIRNLGTVYDNSGNGLISEGTKFRFLTHGIVDTASTTNYDQSYSIATGPFNLAPGQSDTATFAMVGGANLQALRSTAAAARQRYAEAVGYLCGNADGIVPIDIADAVAIIAYIFSGGAAPNPLLAGDADCSLTVDIADAVYLINYIFSGGGAPCAACPKTTR